MGLLDIFRRREKTQARSVYHGTEETYTAMREPLANFGLTISNDAALKMTAYYAGVRLIAENIAALPKRIYRRQENGNFDEVNSAAARAISQRPNSYTNSFDFWFTMEAWLLNRGNAYAFIDINYGDDIVELHQIHPQYVEPKLIRGRKWYKVQLPSDDPRSFLNGFWPEYKMLHLMQFTMDGIVGLNPVIYNAIALNKGAAIERFIASYFRNGGDKRAVLETDGSLGDDAYKTFLSHYNSTGTGGTPLLEYGIKFKQVNIDPVTAALIESEIFSINDICRILNIPPHMLAELSRATFSNIEHQDIQFVKYTLRPTTKRMEVEIESKMFDAQHNVKFVLEGLLRGDTDARTKFYHGAILDGWMSRNEVRKLEGMKPIDGLDEYLYPTNETKVGDESDNT